MNAVQTFANDLSETMTKMEISDFFEEVHTQFYPKQSISFMEYFLELMENENEFIVHHKKLLEYGIVSPSGDVKKKLEKLSLIEDEDYEVSKSSTKSTKRASSNYYLTPSAFKVCLLSGKSPESAKYREYYLLLEKIYKLFTDYERAYAEKLLSMKDDQIAELQRKIKNLNLTGKAGSTKESDNFVILESEDSSTGLKTLSFIAGKTAMTQMKKKMADATIDWTMRSKQKVADPIKLRTKINDAIIDSINKEIAKLNAARLRDLEKLKEDISDHNERNSKKKRSFATEKKELKKIYRKDIPIKSLKLTTTYQENEYISYNDLLKIIKSVSNKSNDNDKSNSD